MIVTKKVGLNNFEFKSGRNESLNNSQNWKKDKHSLFRN